MWKLWPVAIIVATSCVSARQGIEGRVQWVSGNQMPGPGNSNPPSEAVVREVYVYPALKLSSHKPVDGFFSTIDAKPVAIIKSGKDGSFKVPLAPGQYSLLTKEEKGLFANRYDGDGCINCVEVRPREYVEITLKVDYDAAY